MAETETVLFSRFLAEHRRGTVDTEASVMLRELVAETLRTGKKGSMTLTVKTEAKDEFGVIIALEPSNKLPKDDAANVFYFVDELGQPTRRDPQQPLFETKDNARHDHD